MHSMQDPLYHPLFDDAVQMQYKFHDYSAGSASHNTMARALQSEIHQLVQDIAVERSPRSIEDRLKRIEREFQVTAHQPEPIMKYEHHTELSKDAFRMQERVQRFKHY